jgi:hypothetical protein
MSKKVVAVGALMACLGVARSAVAQTPSERVTARQLMDDGDRYVEQKKFTEALRVYAAAHAIMHVPTTGLELARTLAALGRLVEARDAAFEVTRMPVEPGEPKPFVAARREAAELDAELDKRIPTLRIALSGGADPATVHAAVDEDELPATALTLPRRVDPGKRVVHVRAAGFAPVDREVDVPEGSTTVVRVELDAAARSTPVGFPTLAVVGLSTAALGVTVGTITGIISLDRASDARTACGPDTRSCDPSAAGSIDSSKAYGWVSTVSFAVGIVGGAVATYVLLSKPTASRARVRSLDVAVTGGAALLRGTF